MDALCIFEHYLGMPSCISDSIQKNIENSTNDNTDDDTSGDKNNENAAFFQRMR